MLPRRMRRTIFRVCRSPSEAFPRRELVYSYIPSEGQGRDTGPEEFTKQSAERDLEYRHGQRPGFHEATD